MRAALFLLLAAPLLAQAPCGASNPACRAGNPAGDRLTLDQAERLALQNHPRIAAARLEAAAAGQQVTEIRSSYFPTVYGSFTGAGAGDNNRVAAGSLNNPVIFSRLASGLTASQLLFDFGRTGALTSSYRYRALAGQSAALATAADVLLEVNRTYYQALRAQSVLMVARETVQARQVVDDQIRALAQSKLKSGLDVSFADVSLSQARLLLVSAQNGLAGAFAQLSAALGYPSPRLFDVADNPLPPAPPSDFDGVIATAIRKRPELATLRSSQEAARKFFQSEKSLWLPTVSAVTALGFVPDHGIQLPGRYAAAGLNVNIPIFNGHLYSARREEASLREQAAAARVKDEELTVARDVRLAWLAAQDAYQKLDLTRQLLDQARQALDLAQARYDIGLSSIVELSQAQLALTEAQIEQASAKYDYQVRNAELDYQQGLLH
jgi:outer membrane protein